MGNSIIPFSPRKYTDLEILEKIRKLQDDIFIGYKQCEKEGVLRDADPVLKQTFATFTDKLLTSQNMAFPRIQNYMDKILQIELEDKDPLEKFGDQLVLACFAANKNIDIQKLSIASFFQIAEVVQQADLSPSLYALAVSLLTDPYLIKRQQAISTDISMENALWVDILCDVAMGANYEDCVQYFDDYDRDLDMEKVPFFQSSFLSYQQIYKVMLSRMQRYTDMVEFLQFGESDYQILDKIPKLSKWGDKLLPQYRDVLYHLDHSVDGDHEKIRYMLVATDLFYERFPELSSMPLATLIDKVSLLCEKNMTNWLMKKDSEPIK